MSSGVASRPGRIPLIEDDPGDQELTRRALKEERGNLELHVVADGDEALEYLFGRGRYAAGDYAARPDLVLLDLNLPGGAPGKQVLETVKTDPGLRETPVVVLTTSARPRDIRDCYALGANAYVVKPLDARQFFETFRAIQHFWFDVVALPDA